MFKILAILKVKDFAAFEKFESEAAKIMAAYDGKISSAFETARQNDGTGEEIHIIEFGKEADFTEYKNDHTLQELAKLREQAISATDIKILLNEKSYS